MCQLLPGMNAVPIISVSDICLVITIIQDDSLYLFLYFESVKYNSEQVVGTEVLTDA